MARPPRGKRTNYDDGTHAVASKNPNGTGSVYFEPPVTRSDGRVTNGRWRASWFDQNGKLRRVAAPTRLEAEAKRDARASAAGKRLRPASRFDPQSTVNDLLDWWLHTIAKHRVKTSTYDSYARFASYLADGIGSYAIIDVGTEALTEWQSDLLERYAPYTVLNCRKVCRQAFREAVKLDLIAANPFDLVDAPRARAVKNGRALTTDDAKALIIAAIEFRLGAAVTLLFCQGWRVSEVLGLAWEDLDPDEGTAHIRRGSAYTPSLGTVLGTTKTSGAEGIVDERRPKQGKSRPAHESGCLLGRKARDFGQPHERLDPRSASYRERAAVDLGLGHRLAERRERFLDPLDALPCHSTSCGASSGSSDTVTMPNPANSARRRGSSRSTSA